MTSPQLSRSHDHVKPRPDVPVGDALQRSRLRPLESHATMGTGGRHDPISGWAISHWAVGESPSPTTHWEIAHEVIVESNALPAADADAAAMPESRNSTALRQL